MQPFWLFKAPPHKRARIHRGDCSHCNYGSGQKNQHKKDSGPTKWTPFDTLAAAEKAMSGLQYEDTRLCGTCLPGELSN
ncbi:hypothetical protein PsAD14_04080 [Pseudovibrio sp. Ad14]|nr:hypothetical protein PsW74_02941 [Pseudovibrio sp. W74]KZL07690.1 hypothetical protein PsAD14_04080 [Pseudovibrio sp. Ad14]